MDTLDTSSANYESAKKDVINTVAQNLSRNTKDLDILKFDPSANSHNRIYMILSDKEKNDLIAVAFSQSEDGTIQDVHAESM